MSGKVFRTWNGGWGIRGHALAEYGAPFQPNGERIIYKTRQGEPLPGVNGGRGHGKCECGALSPEPFNTATARREWHQAHKAEIAGGSPDGTS